ncbi:hypothetical protein [Candidatus Viridilinea mediisalina]|uniref:Uncharacterized protein n=1 Tax=Candidatus Viridilinea mediisalina TaxID=2024553 RepID=A0A2A6RNA2_9CHLR|nr:hypothetical protein [Candidatus Viridilinea mediisalina]PDW04542.1 hypothetical protein CJ255_03240 [Candidatus Viridilinea mediisalina]
MKRLAITIAYPKSAQVRLTDARDAGHVTVNAFHFDLRPGALQAVTPALQDGVNILRFVVTTQRFREKVFNLDLDRPQWIGRFEFYINEQLVSIFEDQGLALLGGGSYLIAQLELSLYHPIVVPTLPELVNRIRRIPGMTDTVPKDVGRAIVHTSFANQLTIRTWKNRFGVDFVYVCDGDNTCQYAGYVGWVHAAGLRRTLLALREAYTVACP